MTQKAEAERLFRALWEKYFNVFLLGSFIPENHPKTLPKMGIFTQVLGFEKNLQQTTMPRRRMGGAGGSGFGQQPPCDSECPAGVQSWAATAWSPS